MIGELEERMAVGMGGPRRRWAGGGIRERKVVEGMNRKVEGWPERAEISPEEKLEMAGDGDGGGGDAEQQRRRRSKGGGGGTMAAAAALCRRRRLEQQQKVSTWPGQGVAAVVAAAAAAATTAVGLLPRPSLSSHLRGRALLSFFSNDG